MFSEYGAPQLYFTQNSDSLSIIAIPMLYNDTRVINMDYVVGQNGSQQLLLDDHIMMWDTDILLEDLHLNSLIDFKENPIYGFDATTTDDPDRFKIHFLNIVTSTDQNNIDEGVTVYSDDGSIYIINDKSIDKDANIWVYDLLGRKAAVASTGDRVYRIDNLSADQYYIVKVMCNNSVVTKKVYLK